MAEVWNKLNIESTAKGEVLVINQKLFIPKSIRQDLLHGLHFTHTCAKKMWRTIWGIWMWPPLKHEIKQYMAQ